jgi:hypothetical protein
MPAVAGFSELRLVVLLRKFSREDTSVMGTAGTPFHVVKVVRCPSVASSV